MTFAKLNMPKLNMLGLSAALMMGGCGSEAEPVAAPDVPAAADAVVSHADWAGRWIGVEGMFAEISLKPEGGYFLEMQSDLDTLGTYEGEDTAEGISFNRNGEVLVLRAANGDATGLKGLAGKADCLMVASGEGYCRDE